MKTRECSGDVDIVPRMCTLFQGCVLCSENVYFELNIHIEPDNRGDVDENLCPLLLCIAINSIIQAILNGK